MTASRHRSASALRPHCGTIWRTCRERKANFEQARDSYELVKAVQQCLENKIHSLAEMDISRSRP